MGFMLGTESTFMCSTFNGKISAAGELACFGWFTALGGCTATCADSASLRGDISHTPKVVR